MECAKARTVPCSLFSGDAQHGRPEDCRGKRRCAGVPGAGKGSRHAACPCELSQKGRAVCDAERGLSVRHKVHLPGHKEHRLLLPGIPAEDIGRGGKILRIHRIRRSRIHPAGVGRKAAEGPDLRTVPFDDAGPVMRNEFPGVLQPQRAAGHPHRIDQERDAQLMGLCPGNLHGFHPRIIDVPQIHHQGIRRGHDLCRFLRMPGHVGTCPHGQDGIGAVVHRDGVSQAVDQRFLFPDPRHDVRNASAQPADGFRGHRHSPPAFSGIPKASRSGTGW